MEIDFTGLSIPKRSALVASISLVAVIVLGLVGWAVLPDRVLTWTEWQVIQGSLAYNRELRSLQHSADRLAELLNSPPDPVRTQLVTEKVRREMTGMEIASLQGQRESLMSAVNAIEQWSLGSEDQDAAVSAIQLANQSIITATEINKHE